MKESPGRKIREGRWESMTIRYQPRGVCARQFEIQAEDGIIQSVQVTGGCSGNLQGISSLLKGMPVQEAIQRMEGIRCGMKSTSCPDQMAQTVPVKEKGPRIPSVRRARGPLFLNRSAGQRRRRP